MVCQTELGELADLHYTHIGRYECGASRPSADAVRRLADALGVSTDYLMDGVTDEAAKARFKDRELLRQFQQVEDLPDDDKAVVKTLRHSSTPSSPRSRSRSSPADATTLDLRCPYHGGVLDA